MGSEEKKRLNRLTKNALIRIAEALNIEGYKNLLKQELVEKILEKKTKKIRRLLKELEIGNDNPKKRVKIRLTDILKNLLTAKKIIPLSIAFFSFLLYLYFSQIPSDNISGNLQIKGDVSIVTDTIFDEKSPLCGCMDSNGKYAGITFHTNEFEISRTDQGLNVFNFSSHQGGGILPTPALSFDVVHYRIKVRAHSYLDLEKFSEGIYLENIEILEQCTLHNIPFLTVLSARSMEFLVIDSLSTLAFIPPENSKSIISHTYNDFSDEVQTTEIRNIYHSSEDKFFSPVIDVLGKTILCKYNSLETSTYTDSIYSLSIPELDSIIAVDTPNSIVEDVLIFKVPFSLRVESHNMDSVGKEMALFNAPLYNLSEVIGENTLDDLYYFIDTTICGTRMRLMNELNQKVGYWTYDPAFYCEDCTRINTSLVIKKPYNDQKYNALFNFIKENEFQWINFPEGAKDFSVGQIASYWDNSNRPTPPTDFFEDPLKQIEYTSVITERLSQLEPILVKETKGFPLSRSQFRMPPYPKENGIRVFSDIMALTVNSTSGFVKIGEKSIEINSPSTIDIKDFQAIKFDNPLVLPIGRKSDRGLEFKGKGKIYIDGIRQGESRFDNGANLFLLISILAGLAEIISLIISLKGHG